ncbi:MAG: 30S ribosomal protein S6 [Verrucomicrobiota bacterium]
MSETATQRQYTATFILDTRNTTDDLDTVIARIGDALKSLGFAVDKVDNQGQKDFIRTTDRHFVAGIYVAYQLTGPGEASTQVQEKFRLDKQVDRVLVQSR